METVATILLAVSLTIAASAVILFIVGVAASSLTTMIRASLILYGSTVLVSISGIGALRWAFSQGASQAETTQALIPTICVILLTCIALSGLKKGDASKGDKGK